MKIDTLSNLQEALSAVMVQVRYWGCDMTNAEAFLAAIGKREILEHDVLAISDIAQRRAVAKILNKLRDALVPFHERIYREIGTHAAHKQDYEPEQFPVVFVNNIASDVDKMEHAFDKALRRMQEIVPTDGPPAIDGADESISLATMQATLDEIVRLVDEVVMSPMRLPK